MMPRTKTREREVMFKSEQGIERSLAIVKRLIALFLCFLIACEAFKIFGVKSFEIIVNNPTIIKVGNYIDNNLWASVIVCSITLYATIFLFTCAVVQRFYFKGLWINIGVAAFAIGLSVAKNFYLTLEISYAYDLLTYIIAPFLIAKFMYKLSWENAIMRPIIGYVLLVGVIFITATINNLITSELIDNNSLISLILTIDIYILFALIYLYNNFIKIREGFKNG